MKLVLLNKRLKQLRKNHELTLKQLSERSGLSIPFLSDIERGTSSVSIESLWKIAGVYEIDLATLFLSVIEDKR